MLTAKKLFLEAVRPLSSAGVFNASGVLVRTLWSAQTKAPGALSPAAAVAAWDGTLDDGTVAPTGTYTIGKVSSNVTYTWDGVVGNSTPVHYAPAPSTAPQIYLGGTSPIWSMAIADTNDVYFCNSYHEKNSTTYFTTTSDMQHAFSPLWWPRFPPFAAGNIQSTGVNFCQFVCTDGTNMYVVINSGTSPVMGITASTHVKNTYSGADVNGNIGAYGSSGGTAYVTSIAASHTHGSSGYVFLARPAAIIANSELWVLDQVTGNTLHTNIGVYPNAQLVAVSPTTGELWIGYQPSGRSAIDTCEKFTVGSGGSLTTTGVKIQGPVMALGHGLAISPDGSTLLQLDQTTQQVRAYNTSDGSVKIAWGNSGTMGTSGGYSTSPTVTDSKFMFFALAGGLGGSPRGWLCYAPDGSWWLGDCGNYRYLHFSAGNSPAIIERIFYYPACYSVYLMRGDNTRLIGEHLEWKIDYTKPFGVGTGSWTLINNWAYNLDSNHAQDPFGLLRRPLLASNGRTYVQLNNNSSGNEEIWEMATTGLRYTGVPIHVRNWLDTNMDVYSMNSNFGAPGGGSQWRLPFSGFDSSGNPTYPGDATQSGDVFPQPGWVNILTSQATPSQYPDFETFEVPSRALANGILPMQKNRYSPSGSSSSPWVNTYHISGIDGASGVWRYGVHPEAPPLQGFSPSLTFMYFPDAPYTITGGNDAPNPNYQGAFFYQPGAIDFFNSVRGELWGGGQTNMWHHWHQSGLLIGRFGAMGINTAAAPLQVPEYYQQGALQGPQQGDAWWGMPGRSGNTGAGGVAYVPANNAAYIYHGEEWVHSGLHRWTIANYSSIKFTPAFATINWNSASYVPPSSTGGDMLAALPFNNTNLPNSTAGWTRNPTSNLGTWPGTDFFNGNGTTDWTLATNMILADRHVSPDLMVWTGFSGATPPVASRQVAKAIPRHHTGNWTLSIKASYRGNNNFWTTNSSAIPSPLTNPPATWAGQWFDIVDGSGNRIVSVFTGLYSNPARGFSGSNKSMWVNEQPTANPNNYLDLYSWGQYQMGGYSAAQPPIWDGSNFHNLPVLTLSANVGSNQITATYGDTNGVAGSVTVPVYDVGADIVHPTTFQINYKLDATETAMQWGMVITQLQFTEA